MASDDPEVAALRKQVEDLTAVVAELTATKLVNMAVRRHPPAPVMFADLGLRGPAQARDLMRERGLLEED